MLAVSNLGAACIGLFSFFGGLLTCYSLVAWAYRETAETQKNKSVAYDENSYS